jgi:signal transduction histidine kinase
MFSMLKRKWYLSIAKSTLSTRHHAMNHKATFIRQITHDIRGDFYGVTSVCHMLGRAIQKNEDPLPYLDHLTDAFKEYTYKLNNFLEYTRADAGLVDTRRELVDVRQLLNKVMDEYKYLVQEKGTTIDLSIAADLPASIMIDEFRVFQIAANLLVNALTYSPNGSRINLQAAKKSDSWTLVVKDNGEGIGDSKNPAGLGLLVTRYLTEIVLQGKMTVISLPGFGTQVEIELPLEETAN